MTGECCQNEPPTLAAKVAQLSRYIDASYPPGLDPELVMRRRTDKIGVEWGEAQQAIEGWTGENPRKGVTGTVDQVIAELLDVATCALGAVEHLTGNHGDAMPALARHIDHVWHRSGLATGSAPCNAPSGPPGAG